jgi:phenylalanyl-tRNA synthetase alpha chain
MQAQLTKLQTDCLAALAKAESVTAVRELEVQYLGRKGELTSLLRGLKDLSPTEKGTVGKLANEIKLELEKAIEARVKTLENERYAALADTEWRDVTAEVPTPLRGTLHPLTQFQREAERVFEGLGFTIAEGPEVEDDWHCFTALNIPADHPARDSQDTLFLEDSPYFLRTQTSAVQIRWMEQHMPPFRIVAPGRVFRKDDFDASHSPMFHQLEGLVIDRQINLPHMKAVMAQAVRSLINPKAEFRWRTSYFPFVEPGLEVDMSCAVCEGTGCSACKGTGWVEIAGCGLVHPKVLENVKLDPKEWSGFAFGFGIDRMVMMRHKIKDIRLLYENDLRFLKQF